MSELKLISSGKVLENNKTVGQCKAPFGEVPGGVMIMHVVVQPTPAKSKTGMLQYLFSLDTSCPVGFLNLIMRYGI